MSSAFVNLKLSTRIFLFGLAVESTTIDSDSTLMETNSVVLDAFKAVY